MYDVVLIGGGIMSVTLGALIAQLQPTWTIRLFERLDDVALESSNPWNNAGTGHAALCELNYTPEQPDGTIAISKAVTINEQFHMSRQFWDYLARQGVIPPVDTFLSPTPHMTFVRGADNVDYLRRRFNALRTHPNFSELEFSDDPQVIASWAPSSSLTATRTNPSRLPAPSTAQTSTLVASPTTWPPTSKTTALTSLCNTRFAVFASTPMAPGRSQPKTSTGTHHNGPQRSGPGSSLLAQAEPLCISCKEPASPKSKGTADSPSPECFCARHSRKSSLSTRPRFMEKPPSDRHQCRCRTLTPVWWTEQPHFSLDPTQASPQNS